MKEEKSKKQKSRKKRRVTLIYILSGGVLKEDFFIRHIRMIIVIVLLLFFYIGNSYTCLLKLREINRLQRELQDVKNEFISVSGQLTGNNRLSQIEELVKMQGLEVESAKTPPYILRK
jgi:hypothetical protein